MAQMEGPTVLIHPEEEEEMSDDDSVMNEFLMREMGIHNAPPPPAVPAKQTEQPSPSK